MQIRIGLIVCGASLAVNAVAQESAPPAEVPNGIYIPVEPLERTPPGYPSRALSQRREGWARASFIISEEGEVIEPMIEESSHPDFDAPTLRALERWRFKPATLDGKPVEQSMMQTIIRYQLSDEKGATRAFIKSYREIYSLLLAGDLAAATPLMEALDQGALNFYEDAWLGWLQFVYLEASRTAEPEALVKALGRALGSTETEDDNYLEPDMFVFASQRLFELRARGNDFSGAIRAFERLEDSNIAQRSKRYPEALAAIEPFRQGIMNLVAGPEVLAQRGRIDDNHYWVRRLLRRSFAVGDVQGGQLTLIDLRCARANRRFGMEVAESILGNSGFLGRL